MLQNKINTENLTQKSPRGNINSFGVFKKLTCVNCLVAKKYINQKSFMIKLQGFS